MRYKTHSYGNINPSVEVGGNGYIWYQNYYLCMYTPQEIERYTKMLLRKGVPENAVASILDFVYTIASVAIDSEIDEHEKNQEIEKEYRKAS